MPLVNAFQQLVDAVVLFFDLLEQESDLTREVVEACG
jgi:hypothetical protein